MDEKKRRKRGGRRRKEGDVGGEGRNEPPFLPSWIRHC
jgi:hypothetical protein